MTSKDKSVYIVPIVVGLFAAFFANIDRAIPAFEKLVSRSTSGDKTQKWTSVYRDVTENLDGETIVSANFNFDLEGDSILGKEDTPNNSNRSWKNIGKIHKDWVASKEQGPFIVVNYKSITNNPIRASIGSIVLEPVEHSVPPSVKEYRGYWLGHEPDLDKIIVCPYILSSDTSASEIESRNQQWLNQSCTYRI